MKTKKQNKSKKIKVRKVITFADLSPRDRRELRQRGIF